MARKASKTALNIRSINSYITNIAKIFGTNSAEYEAATIPLKQFDIRDKIVNGQRVVQIKNTAANRRKHQTIRSIRKNRKPIQILKRRLAKEAKKTLQTLPSIDKGEQAKNFYRWYATMKKEFIDLTSEIYALAEALEKIGETLDFTGGRPWKDADYRMDMWERVYNAVGDITPTYNDFTEWLNNSEDINADGVNTETGENVTFTNSDYEAYDMELDDYD